MKKITGFIIVMMIFGNLFADVGECVRYKVKLVTSDGNTIVGDVFVNVSGPLFQFQDNNIKDYIEKYGMTCENKITVYPIVSEILYPDRSNNINSCRVHLNAAPANTVQVIPYDKIVSIDLLEYNTCHNCDNFDEKDGFKWIGTSPNVITELTEKEISLLQTKPLGIYTFPDPNDEYSDYVVLSYNSSYDSEKLKKLSNDYISSLQQLTNNKDWDGMKESYINLKANFREKDIIIFKLETAN